LAFQPRLCISAATSLAPHRSHLGAFLEALEHFLEKVRCGLDPGGHRSPEEENAIPEYDPIEVWRALHINRGRAHPSPTLAAGGSWGDPSGSFANADKIASGRSIPDQSPGMLARRPSLIYIVSVFKKTQGKTTMAWTTPTLVEICIGLEINGYLPAEF
jgi:coenzyme PQQ precursor peptide PqqA